MTIGQALERKDGDAKVTGQARYTADTSLPGLTFAAMVSSTASARCMRISPTVCAGSPLNCAPA